VSPFTRRPDARYLSFPLVLLAVACGQKTDTPTQPPQPQVVEPVTPIPGEIELSDPKVSLQEPNVFRFEVKYRFTKGQPDKYYSCDISFPGTENHGRIVLEQFEVKKEGVIRDGIELHHPGVKTFAIHMSESVSPQERYKKISNVVSGPVE